MKRVITKNTSFLKLFSEIVTRKELLILLIKRDLYLRYKYKTIGILWGVAQPLLLALIISASLGRIAPHILGAPNYFLSVFVGYIFWMYFSASIGKATTSISGNRTLIQNSAFPHLILPLSTIGVGLIDFITSFLLALIIGFLSGLYISFLPLIIWCIAIMLITIVGIGALFSALFVRFADIRELLSFSLTALFYLTPIIYPVRLIPPQFQTWLYLNPMTGVIETAKGIFFNAGAIHWEGLLISTLSSLCIFFFGIFVFQKIDTITSDIL